MSYANHATSRRDEIRDEDIEEVDVVVGCSRCYEQVEPVFYDRVSKSLFWRCSNGHEGSVEDFGLFG
jgi:hypothetical protein